MRLFGAFVDFAEYFEKVLGLAGGGILGFGLTAWEVDWRGWRRSRPWLIIVEVALQGCEDPD